MGRRYLIVDVFAERPYAGNQLAVVFAEGNESDDELQAIAREFGFSETVFLLPGHDSGKSKFPPGPGVEHAVRIFTPGEELPFAGHPTLGAAWVIRHAAAGAPRGAVTEVTLGEKIGPIRTWFENDSDESVVWMQQNPPEFGRTLDPSAAARAIGLALDDIDPGMTVQLVSTGIPFVIIPLRSRAAVSRARARIDLLPELFGSEPSVPVFLFAMEAEERGHQVRARMFAPQYGIAEDPATGSACGCLAGYLVEHRVLGDRLNVAVEQGYEMERPSVLYLEAERESGSAGPPTGTAAADDTISVRVGGRVRLFATGELG